MTCREVLDFLDRYLEGALSPAERLAFEAHVDHCQACVAYIRSYERTRSLGKAAVEDDGDIPDDLVDAILAARKRKE